MPTSSGLAPTITATGITAGNFAQWQAFLIAQYQSIYGADSYLGNDSQDGQFIGVIAQALADCGAGAIAVYNSFSPLTAQGAGLASNVKINGLKKLIPSNSSVVLTIGGTANTTINNGQAIDTNQVVWNLPASVTIPLAGAIDVTAICATPGAVNASSSSITKIQTPLNGWQTVTNGAAAVPGAPVESDAQLRVRQGKSVALPSVTIFEGIVAAIGQVTGVTRVKGYENNTGTVNENGIPANTLYFIVEGGTEAAIFQAIFSKITPGIPTMGSITTTITDANGSTRLLKYDVPVDATISVAIGIKALNGWQTSTQTLIANALIAYLEQLAGGANISYLAIPSIALLLGTPFAGTFQINSLTLKKNAGAAAAADIQLVFNEMAVADATDITFTVS